MKIVQVDVYGYDLSYRYGQYVMSQGRTVASLPSTLVRVQTDEGLEGWGEGCPLGPAYLPSFAQGVRAALHELAPALLGLDPREIGLVHRRMDEEFRGHPDAKAPIDIACWDLLGKATGTSVATLLGGRHQEDFLLYEAVPLGSSDEMVAYVLERQKAGICRFQLKLGDDPFIDADRVARVLEVARDEDLIIADANGGWRLADAMAAVNLFGCPPRLFLEQPCATLEECVQIRRFTTLPMVLDEVINTPGALIKANQLGGMDAINLKISKVGGLMRARVMRDLADSLGLRLTIEDTWGGDVTTAAISHLAASTPADATLTVSFMNDWVQEHIAGYQPRSNSGRGSAPTGPGLGVEVDVERLGSPLFSISA